MIKHLLLGTFLLTSPLPFKATTLQNVLYVTQNYNKSLSQEYTKQTADTLTYAQYSFNQNDEWQTVGGIINTRTTTINLTSFDNTTNTITCIMRTYTEYESNYYKYEIWNNANNQVNFGNTDNIIQFGYTQKKGNENLNQQTLENLMLARYTNVDDIITQNDNIGDLLDNDSPEVNVWISKSQYEQSPLIQIQSWNEYITSFTELADRTGTRIYNSIDNYQYKQGYYGTLIYKYQINEDYQNLDPTTINFYKNVFLGFKQTLKVNVEYEPKNIIITTETIDIPDLLFTLIGMPFAWISTAFNLTIFPNTPYAINISHLILSLIAILIAIFIIKKLIK